MIAIQGSKQMMRQPTERILPMIPVLVPALRSCLHTFNPPAVAAALDLVRFLLTNPEGPVVERWFHAQGCRRWVTVRRDTRTDAILDPPL